MLGFNSMSFDSVRIYAGVWGGRAGVSLLLLAVGLTVAWSYDSKGVGIRFFDWVLRAIVWFETASWTLIVSS